MTDPVSQLKSWAIETVHDLESNLNYLPDDVLLSHLEKVSTELKRRNSLMAVDNKEVSVDALKAVLEKITGS